MTLPAAISASGTQRHAWIEVEGWPTCYGTFSASASFFAGRAATDRFLGVRPFFRREADGLVRMPELSPATLDYRDGRAKSATVRLPLVDQDGSIQALTCVARRDQQCRLATGLDPSATSVAFTGDASGWADDGAIYANREAMSYAGAAGSPQTVVRGAYRSERTTHAGAGSGSAGDVLAPYPLHIIGQRVWIRYWSGIGAPVDADAVTVFAGQIAGYSWEDAGQTIALDLEDSGTQLRRSVGQKWIDSKKPNGKYPTANVLRATEQSGGLEIIGIDDREQTSKFYGQFFRFDSEIIFVWPSGGLTYTWNMIRSPLPTIWHGHQAGTLYPCYVVSDRYGLGTDDALYYTDFHADPSGLAGNHPLVVLLHFLASTGGRTVAPDWTITPGPNGSYDTLPQDWGLGIPQGQIDVARILALALRRPSLQVRFALWEAIPDFRQWATDNLLTPFGYALRVRFDGTIDVVDAAPPSPGDLAGAATIADSGASANIVRDAASHRLMVGPWSTDVSGQLAAVSWQDSPYFADDKGSVRWPDAEIFPIDTDAGQAARSATGDTMEIRSGGTYRDIPNLSTWAIRGDDATAQTTANLILFRYGSPAMLVEATVPLSLLAVDPGDWVLLTVANAPNPFGASRGLAATPAEVWTKKTDLTKATITFGLAMLPTGQTPTRLLAPSATVLSYDAGTKLYAVKAADYTTGDAKDSDGFAPGDVVRIYSPDYAERTTTAVVVAVTRNGPGDPDTIELDANPSGHSVGTGDILTIADHSECTATQAALYAHRAGADELLDGGAAEEMA